MALVASLPRAVGAGRKLSVAQAAASTGGALTGSAAVATQLKSIDAGGAVSSVANSPTTAPGNATGPCYSTITSITGGTVNVLALQAGNTGNLQSAGGFLINVIATGF